MVGSGSLKMNMLKHNYISPFVKNTFKISNNLFLLKLGLKYQAHVFFNI